MHKKSLNFRSIALIEYAYLKGTTYLAHVDDVPNGKGCDCVCVGCGDALVAKNNCVDKANHFSHDCLAEKRSCRMTQLHIFAQNYFASLEKFTLPLVNFEYKGRNLFKSATEVEVYEAKMEAKIGKYFADVVLSTSVGDVIIEVLVSHKTENDKSAYYQKEGLACLEVDLSKFLKLGISDAHQSLKSGTYPREWIHEWCKNELIAKCEEDFLKKKRELIRRRRLTALQSAKKLIEGCYAPLPSIKETISCTIHGREFQEEVTLFAKREQGLSNLVMVEEEDDWILLKGGLGERTLWVAYLFEQDVPKRLNDLDGSVIVREPTSESSSGSEWRWLIHPKLTKRRDQEMAWFKESCLSEIMFEKSTKESEEIAAINSEVYLSKTDDYFKRDYRRWANWMINNRLYRPAGGSNPKIPVVLKYRRKFPSLWVFGAWHVAVLSQVAEVMDTKPLKVPVPHSDIFNELASVFGVSQAFIVLEKGVHPSKVTSKRRDITLRRRIIECALEPYMMDDKVRFVDKGVMRTGSLKDSLYV